MYKKSLLFGAAALALLVLFAFVGCSNPSSGSTEYVSQASSDYPYPADTVFANDWDSFLGLLNDYNAETNRVQNIAYSGNDASFVADLIIPAGKTVYFNAAHTNITKNITVREGARLVLVEDFSFTSATSGYLLVRGTVEVFKTLQVARSARDVADYSVENAIEPGRNTVIGKNVTVLPGAVLYLHVEDIIPPTESQPNKFTPQQAWAAAGQGHLVIGTGGSIPGTPNVADLLPNYSYTVTELLTGVSPSATRSYTVASNRITSEILPQVIPQGAYILTRAIPTNSADGTLIVNGSLITFGTLNGITRLELGNGGALYLAEPDGELLTGLTDLRLGPGADLEVLSDDVSLKALTALFLGDGSHITVPGTNVTFKEDTDLALTLGKNVTYMVGMSASATIDTVVAKDAGLVGGSTLTVYQGSTFTVNDGVTFTVGFGSTFDVGKQPIPAAGDTPPIAINGTIEIVAGGHFVGPDFDTVQADPTALAKTINLGENGKVLLDWGADFYFGSTAGQKFVGASADTATYTWCATSTDGAQIETNKNGLIIRDIDDIDISPVKVTIKGPGAGIIKGQSLYLDRGVTLALDNTVLVPPALYLFGGTEGIGETAGARLLGPGKVQLTGAGTIATGAVTITGGNDGWQAIGDNIAITSISSGADKKPSLLAISNASPPSATVSATLKAMGLGAAIEVGTAVIVSSPYSYTATPGALTIWDDLTIDLNGTNARQTGRITLVAASTITLDTADSEIITGATPPGHTAAVALTNNGQSLINSGPNTFAGIGITGLTGTANVLAVTTAVPDLTNIKLLAGKLVSLTGSASPGIVTAPGANTSNVDINSELVTDDI